MIGISVYPYKENIEETKAYVNQAGQIGVKRLFTNFLAVDDIEAEIKKYQEVFTIAKKYQMEIAIDVAPQVFTDLKIPKNDFSFFEKLGATIIRLDSGYDGLQEALYSYNEQNLKIELNISYDNPHIETILSYCPRKNALLGCHNFYPQAYTGLELEHFVNCTNQAKKLGLRTAAFVSSQAQNTHGPHAYDNKLCSLEMHRNLPISTQAKHLMALGIDDIIVANTYASFEELAELVSLSEDYLTFNVTLDTELSTVEKEVLFENLHFNRGDINAYVHRSTYVKLTVQDKSIPRNNAEAELTRGAITIGNDLVGQYEGELDIVKQSLTNIDSGRNKVAQIIPEELFLIDYIKPWGKFRFQVK